MKKRAPTNSTPETLKNRAVATRIFKRPFENLGNQKPMNNIAFIHTRHEHVMRWVLSRYADCKLIGMLGVPNSGWQPYRNGSVWWPVALTIMETSFFVIQSASSTSLRLQTYSHAAPGSGLLKRVAACLERRVAGIVWLTADGWAYACKLGSSRRRRRTIRMIRRARMRQLCEELLKASLRAFLISHLN